jgi:alcohol dehydrogenase class IV
MNFTFYTAGEIIFAAGKISELGAISRRFGSKVMICVRGSSMEKYGVLESACRNLAASQVAYSVLTLPEGEPDVTDIDAGAERARAEKPDAIVGLGGGSTIDSGKAISGLVTNPGSVIDYLEGVGQCLEITQPALPYIAIPTTAGTGSEATKNAVISSKTGKFKKSMRSAHLLPRVALLDPELTLSLPSKVTAETGLDALTQLIEAYVSAKSQPIPDALTVYGIRLVGRYLKRAVQNSADLQAREGMMLAALLSGISLANAGLGAAHGIAAALGAVCGISHGRACAMLLPVVMRANQSACIERFADIAEALSGAHESNQSIAAEKAVTFVEKLCLEVGIPAQFAAGEVKEKDLPELVAASFGSSMKGNPLSLSKEQVEGIIRTLL